MVKVTTKPSGWCPKLKPVEKQSEVKPAFFMETARAQPDTKQWAVTGNRTGNAASLSTPQYGSDRTLILDFRAAALSIWFCSLKPRIVGPFVMVSSEVSPSISRPLLCLLLLLTQDFSSPVPLAHWHPGLPPWTSLWRFQPIFTDVGPESPFGMALQISRLPRPQIREPWIRWLVMDWYLVSLKFGQEHGSPET